MAQRYKIEGKLGEGGMGVVYKARHLDLDRMVAIKYLLSDGDLSDVGIARFKREMDTLIALSHPNIIKVYDAGETDGKLFYVMEMLVAKDLTGITKDRGALSAPVVMSILDQILDALQYCHERKIIHRDLKPQNIMLEPSGRAILMDFGLVRKIDATVLTAQGKLLGTPRYFPPEYIRGEEATAAGDIWSLGVVAYELLAGCRPFDGGTLAELAGNILKAPIPPLDSIKPETPPGLVALINKMLIRDPHKRIADAKTARALLAEIANPADRKELEELSREISADTLAEVAMDVKSQSGVTRRFTAKTKARPTLSKVSVVAPPVEKKPPWAAIAIGAVLVLGAAGAWFATRPGGSGSATAAAVKVADLVVRYDPADKLVVTFHSGGPAAFTLEPEEGAPVVEPSPAAEHWLVLPVDPGRAPERVTLVGPGVRERLTLPESPTSRVRALARALRAAKLDEKLTDRMFETIRRKMPKWKVSKLAEGNTTEGCSPAIAQDAVRATPKIAQPFHDGVKQVREAAGVAEHLDAVLAWTPGLMMAKLPDPVRDDLYDALFRLDLLDGMGEYLEMKTVFGVQDKLAPAMRVQQRPHYGRIQPPGPEDRVVALPAAGKKGIVLHHEKENFMMKGFEGGTSILEPSLDNRESLEIAEVADPGPVGPGGRRWEFWVDGMSTQLTLYMVPPGAKAGVPVRLRGVFNELWNYTVFDVTFTGPLAQVDRFTLLHKRLFMAASRTYFGIDALRTRAVPAAGLPPEPEFGTVRPVASPSPSPGN